MLEYVEPRPPQRLTLCGKCWIIHRLPVINHEMQSAPEMDINRIFALSAGRRMPLFYTFLKRTRGIVRLWK